jgi:hypothetical protein
MSKLFARAVGVVAILTVAAFAATATAAVDSAVAIAPPGAKPAEQFFNVDRSYPDSCLQAPLVLGRWQDDPNHVQKTVELTGDPNSSDATERAFKETDTITVFRVPCTTGLSATMIEINRPCGTACTGTTYPTMPRISVAQGSLNLIIRIAQDPNTFYSNVHERAPLYASSVFTLENAYGAHSAGIYFAYGQAFTLTVNNLESSNNLTTFTLANYDASQYPLAAQPLPITGYMSTNWSNPNQDTDGMVVQVYDGYDFATRIFTFAWFTFDNNHRPFWLFGQGSLANGSRTVTVPVAYFISTSPTTGTHGTSTKKTWGTATITFPDCAHMSVQYTGDASADQGPTGTGTIVFTRTADVNSIVCN